MGRSLNATATSGALTVQAFVGDGCTLLAFDLKRGSTQDFAGFAIHRTAPGGAAEYILNALSFDAGLTHVSSETDVHRAVKTSDVAPIQKYRWIDFPSDVNSGAFTYLVETKYFDPDEMHLRTGDSVTVSVNLGSRQGTHFHVGFTRGFMSSQAYVRRFPDVSFRPDDRTDYLFDSAPYARKWAWLGYHARRMVFDFLEMAKADEVASVDAFVYDVDEPDFVRAMMEIGQKKTKGNLRIILDDSLEGKAVKPDRAAFAQALEPVIGAENILRTHFKRFAHDKVLILRDAQGQATHVLCGSANFFDPRLYVQGNSVIVVDDSDVAETYAMAFDAAWTSTKTFSKQPIANTLFTFDTKSELPNFAVTFAPHGDGEYALAMPANAIRRAGKNVIFALMSPGGGVLIDELKNVMSVPAVFSFGTLQTEAFAMQLMQGGGETKGGKIENEISSFKPLNHVVPPPFLKEYDGGSGQTIHHKFVVVDFNGTNPVVFCGSSNLTSGGEAANGDNLLAIYDREIATLYAIEGIRLADHYAFRDKLAKATHVTPMALQGIDTAKKWYADYYVPGTAKYRSRLSLIQ